MCCLVLAVFATPQQETKGARPRPVFRARLAWPPPPHRRGGRRREERKFAEEVLHRPHFGIQLEWGAFLTIDTVLEAASPIDQARVDRLAFAVNVVRVGGACRSGLVALTRPRHRRRDGVLAGAGTGETD